MKKNLITVVILALVLVNLILTAILTITVVPQTKKANELITQVCSAINLELKSGSVTSDMSSVPMDKLASHSIADQLTINLADAPHVAVLTVAISMNTESEGYKTYGASVTDGSRNDLIKGKVNDVVGSHTYAEMSSTEGKQAVKNEIVEELQKMFDSDFIVSVDFPTITCQ